jgi:Rod binding domain-containing protein
MEAQFLHQLLRAMRRTIPATQSSYATQMYTDMMDEALAQQLAQSDQFGLGRLLYEKLCPYVQATEKVSGGGDNEHT